MIDVLYIFKINKLREKTKKKTTKWKCLLKQCLKTRRWKEFVNGIEPRRSRRKKDKAVNVEPGT